MYVFYNAHRHVSNLVGHNIWKYTGNVNMAKINERYYRRKWCNRGVQEYEYSSLINTSYAAFKTACKTIHK